MGIHHGSAMVISVSFQPNKPMVPAAPAPAKHSPLPSRRRHIGQPSASPRAAPQ